MDFSTMSYEELQKLREQISKEIENKKEEEFHKAVENLKAAYFFIKKNFPVASWLLPVEDEHGYEFYIDLMEMDDYLFDNISK